ncbi:MAG: dihydrodipicolinate synthase family protein [Acidobacteria bacterium]|nr:MAG: dihydrodipicolinate synthase family protein [Acidobacteriota bacterium]
MLQPSGTFRIDGIIPIIPTPFTEEQQVACEDLGDLIEFARTAGACAICLPAYASEFYKLSEAERIQLIREAVRLASGRIPVIAQVNYLSSVQAAEVAACSQELGVAAVSTAVPRLFALAERDLYRHFERILSAISIPLIIQDFNPGGATVSPVFIKTLHRAFPHFRYVKLEEPLMAAKVEAIRRETEDEVGVIEGWGGMYILELRDAGICGVMPGLALTDLLARVYRLASDGKKNEAYDIFQGVLPQIVYSLQNIEMFHHAEKLLLQARGVVRYAHVRDAKLEMHPYEVEHIQFLNGRILALLDRLNMPVNPAARGEA